MSNFDIPLLQTVYRNAHAFLGNILGITQYFPAPKDLFSGAVWVVLYTACAINGKLFFLNLATSCC